MIVLDEDKILVGIRKRHLANLIFLLLITSIIASVGTFIYRHHVYNITNFEKVEKGWKAAVGVAWCPWQEKVYHGVFRVNGSSRWHYLETGEVVLGIVNEDLNRKISTIENKKIAEEFK